MQQDRDLIKPNMERVFAIRQHWDSYPEDWSRTFKTVAAVRHELHASNAQVLANNNNNNNRVLYFFAFPFAIPER